jgi:hypothetical protein
LNTFETFSFAKIVDIKQILNFHHFPNYKILISQATWACNEAKHMECPSKIQVLTDGLVDKIVWRAADHNHMPDVAALEAKVVLSNLWHAAVQTDINLRQLVADEFQKASLEVQINLPEPDRLRSNLMAARRAVAKKSGLTTPGTPKEKAKKRKGDESEPELQLAETPITKLDDREVILIFS